MDFARSLIKRHCAENSRGETSTVAAMSLRKTITRLGSLKKLAKQIRGRLNKQ
jgi:hypothetical protein